MPWSNKEDRRRYLKEYHKKWYSNPENKKAKIANASLHKKANAKRNRLFVNEYKKAHGCSKCAENDPCCLDFHHIEKESKVLEVSLMVIKAWSLEKIKKEIDKCIILCANCHRKLHNNEE